MIRNVSPSSFCDTQTALLHSLLCTLRMTYMDLRKPWLLDNKNYFQKVIQTFPIIYYLEIKVFSTKVSTIFDLLKQDTVAPTLFHQDLARLPFQ